VVLMGKL